jgi:hypothetical protein
MWKAVLAAIVVYIALDAAGTFVLTPFGLNYLHAFIAMFFGMLVGGYLAGRMGKGFLLIALVLNLGFSGLNYVIVANMREQSVLSLIAEQHLMVSVGSIIGAVLGAWVGGQLASRKEQPA